MYLLKRFEVRNVAEYKHVNDKVLNYFQIFTITIYIQKKSNLSSWVLLFWTAFVTFSKVFFHLSIDLFVNKSYGSYLKKYDRTSKTRMDFSIFADNR